MKTNQILTRKMGDFDVTQRTSDCMFNATSLLKQWNEHSESKKELKDFFDNKSTKEFINVLKDRENLNRDNSPYLATRGKNGGTWMHPYLFIDFAMWINPEFKYNVIKFVHDQLIQYRNDAGDSYKDMTAAVCKLVTGKKEQSKAIIEVARANNHIVYGTHTKEIRNKDAEESKMKQLIELQKDISKLINDGFVNSFDNLMNYLRRKYNQQKLIA